MMTKSDNMNFKKILVGLDASSDSILAFHYAVDRASATDAQLILCSVMDDDVLEVFQSLEPSFIYGRSIDARKHLNHYKKVAEKYGVKDVRIVIVKGDAGEMIVKDVIPHVNPDLLVIGSKAKKGLARHFGSQAAYMAKYATIPVMVVR